jgi:hypothetical protein
VNSIHCSLKPGKLIFVKKFQNRTSVYRHTRVCFPSSRDIWKYIFCSHKQQTRRNYASFSGLYVGYDITCLVNVTKSSQLMLSDIVLTAVRE